MVLWLVDESVFEWLDAFSVDNTDSERFVKRSNIAQCHDARESGVSFCLSYVVDQCSLTTCVGDKFRQLWRLFGDFSDACCSVFPYQRIDVLQAVENSGEDFCFHHHVGELDGVLRDLSETRTDVSL